MRLDVTALALTAGLLWGAAMLIVASANLIWPNYGQAFLALVASVYPGYRPGRARDPSSSERFTPWWTAQSAAACSPGSTTSSRAGARAAQRNQRMSSPSR
jgi:hypothetical protein